MKDFSGPGTESQSVTNTTNYEGKSIQTTGPRIQGSPTRQIMKDFSGPGIESQGVTNTTNYEGFFGSRFARARENREIANGTRLLAHRPGGGGGR